MGSKVDLTGQRFGRLLVVREDGNRNTSGSILWNCICDCGKEVSVSSGTLRSGKTKSCGCLRRDTFKSINGIPHPRLSSIYWAMKERCYKPYNLAYHNYGGRGIRICDEWLDAEKGHDNFIRWALENGYSDDLTIDRIDVNGNYEPSNCRWATKSEQSRNTRRNRYVTYNGEKMCLQKAAELSGIKASTIRSRISYGWSEDRLFDTVRPY